jgi:hypothetical protein
MLASRSWQTTFPFVSVKEQALQVVTALPDDVTWSEALERMRIAAALEKAAGEVKAGHFVTQTEAKTHIDACLRKLSGPSAA